ncbi:MAG: ammonia-forming cytochrome c nitrite reductase subunit c552 [Bacillota bacterium]|nr:ammonia-forming cytochrome c nitrite reductase subunit c552 [Bacillota bacterium]
MKLKKKFSLLILLLTIFALTACGSKDQAEKENPVSENPTEATSDGDKVVATKDFPKDIAPVEDYKEAFPAVVASFEKNSQMEATTYGGSVQVDYLAEYPYLKTFYKGYVFEHQYDRARGHVYALEDVMNTKRPKAGASCLACKVSIYNEEFVKDPSLAAMDFDQYIEAHGDIVGFTCYDCHGDTPGKVQINRKHLQDHLDANPDPDYLRGSMLSCAQCHVEYYMTADEKIVKLPWTQGLGADEAYKYYQDLGFYDWVHELTGAKVLKAQHPETETFNGSVHQMAKLDCLACHMPRMDQDGETIYSHHWTSPLKTPEASCLKCHSDQTAESIVKMAESIQKPVVERTDALGKDLEAYILNLADLVAMGGLDETNLEKLQDIQREAQFYWDYVFVENSEGFHNQGKALQYLDHCEQLIKEGNDLIESL